MSVIKCLMQKAESGLISKKSAAAITNEITRLQELQGAGANVTKELAAAQQAFDIIQNRLVQRTRQASIHASLVESGLKRFESGAPVADVLKSFSFTDEANGYKHGFLGPAAEETVQNYQRIFTGMAADVLDKLDPRRLALFRDPASQLEIQKDLFASLRGQGQRSADAEIRAVSDQIQALTKAGAEAFEKAGGNITQRKDFILGRSPNAQKIIQVSQEEYIKDSLQAFDLDAVREATDGAINTEEDLAKALSFDYQAQASGGLVDIADFAPKGVKSVVNSRNHHRIFHFKDAESYQAWQQKYGEESLYQQVVNYGKMIGKDVGILETYGPKPEAFIRSMLRQAAQIDPVGAANVRDRVTNAMRYVTGQWDRGLNPTVSKWMATGRALGVANKLGSTVIDAAIMDTVGLGAVAKSVRGLPILKSTLETFKTLLSPELQLDRKEWAKLGWYLDGFLQDSLAHLRASEAEGGHRLAQMAATGVMKYTGLTRMTDATKGASVKILGDKLANESWETLPKQFTKWLAANGVDEATYREAQQLGKTAVDRWGVEVMDPTKLYNAGRKDLAVKMGTLFNRVQELVSPTTSPEVRAWFSGAERGGALQQIGIGSLKMFSGYLGSFWNNHLKTIYNMPGMGDKTKYAGAMTLGLVTTGILSTWVRDIVNGKDPKLDDDTVMKAFARSNVIPLLGDYLFSGGTRFGGGGLGDKLVGPIVGDAWNLGKAASNLVAGKTKAAGADTQRFLESLIPGKNAWFAGLALKRTMLDQARHLYDPEADKYFRSKVKRDAREGTTYWWEPGQTAPKRAPDIGAIVDQPFFPAKKGK